MLTIVHRGDGLGIVPWLVSRRSAQKDEDGAARRRRRRSPSVSSRSRWAVWLLQRGAAAADDGATPSMIASSLGYTQVMFLGNAIVTLLP